MTDLVLLAELDAKLHSLRIAFDKELGDELVSLFDISRMVDEILTQMQIEETRQKRFALSMSFKNTIRKIFQTNDAIRWDTHTIQRVIHGDRDDTWFVYGRFWDSSTQTMMKIRWSFARTDGRLLAFNWEELDAFDSLLTVFGIISVGRLEWKPWYPSYAAFYKEWGQAAQAGSSIPIDRFIQASESILQFADIPKEVEANVRLIRASRFLAEAEFENLLVELNLAEETAGNKPALHTMRARAFISVGRADDALRSIQRYVEAVGWDPIGHELAAQYYRRKGDEANAQKHAALGARDLPVPSGAWSASQ